MKDMTIGDRAIALIIQYEGLSHCEWPGGASGVTIGRGYDLGYHTAAELLADWGPYLPQPLMERLRRCLGVKGLPAKALAAKLQDVHIPADLADRVFVSVDVPRWINRTSAAFAPGYELLPDDAQGALVSLVFNRGDSMGKAGSTSFESRREMRQIRDVLAALRPGESIAIALAKVAAAIRSMKRLWIGQHMDGLIRRREAEAKLIDGAIAALQGAA